MNKVIMLFIAAIALCACDNNPFTPKSATLYCGDSFRVTTKGISVESLQSTNDFVASVDVSGMVKARHVGSAAITALPYVLSDGTIAYDANNACEVTVKPRYEYFVNPVTEWYLSQEKLVERIGKPDSVMNMGVTALIYGDYETGDATGYIFVDNELVASSILSRTATTKMMKDYLDERYCLTDMDGDDLYYEDNYDNATLIILAGPAEDENGYLMSITYNPHPNVRKQVNSKFKQLNWLK